MRNKDYVLIAKWFETHKPNAEIINIESGDISGMDVYKITYHEFIDGVGLAIVESLYTIDIEKAPDGDATVLGLKVVDYCHIEVIFDRHKMNAKDLDISALLDKSKYTKYAMCGCPNCGDHK